MKQNLIERTLLGFRSTHGLHGVILVVLPLPAEDGGQGLARVHVPCAQDVGLASGRHSENRKNVR